MITKSRTHKIMCFLWLCFSYQDISTQKYIGKTKIDSGDYDFFKFCKLPLR